MILPFLTLAQASPPPPIEIVQPQEVRPLPGRLDRVPVFNSNSPELILNPGILLSTFPAIGKTYPYAHLNYAFEGRFDLFAHHVAKASTPDDLRTLYLGIILYNPGTKPVTVKILQAATYLSQPDAPFIQLPSQVEDAEGQTYAGPGSRVMGDIARGVRQGIFPSELVIEPGNSQILLNLPIPVRDLDPPINGRSSYFRLESDGQVYAASLAMFAPTDETGEERSPTLEEWETLLQTADLATPRDRAPSPLGANAIIYGRVAGVSEGSVWQARLATEETYPYLHLPPPGQAISYGLSTLETGTLGTHQIQSAAMLVRYPDTAYKAHGNYGVQYSLTLPLYNPTNETQTVTVSLQTPIKQDQIDGGLRFFDPPANAVFFRGTVRVRFVDETGTWQTRYFHLVQRRGEQGQPLVTQEIPGKQWRLIKLDFLYPPDATPPQVLTIKNDKIF